MAKQYVTLRPVNIDGTFYKTGKVVDFSKHPPGHKECCLRMGHVEEVEVQAEAETQTKESEETEPVAADAEPPKPKRTRRPKE